MNPAFQSSRRRCLWHRHDPYASFVGTMAPQSAGRAGSAPLPRASAPMAVQATPAAYRFGGFVLDLRLGALLAADGTERTLRPKSFALLCLLVQNAGRLLSHDTIMEAVWPGTAITDNSVSQCVHDIRRALGGADKALLRTVSRRGYLFTAQVAAGSAFGVCMIDDVELRPAHL